jgi:inorganic pyrophosphatase
MSKNGNSRSALADPSRLQSLDDDHKNIIQVVIETPKGSRNKYAFDVEQKVFEESFASRYDIPVRFRIHPAN